MVAADAGDGGALIALVTQQARCDLGDGFVLCVDDLDAELKARRGAFWIAREGRCLPEDACGG